MTNISCSKEMAAAEKAMFDEYVGRGFDKQQSLELSRGALLGILLHSIRKGEPQ